MSKWFNLFHRGRQVNWIPPKCLSISCLCVTACNSALPGGARIRSHSEVFLSSFSAPQNVTAHYFRYQDFLAQESRQSVSAKLVQWVRWSIVRSSPPSHPTTPPATLWMILAPGRLFSSSGLLHLHPLSFKSRHQPMAQISVAQLTAALALCLPVSGNL